MKDHVVTAGWSLLPLAVACAVMLTAHKVSPNAITGLGLISVLPVTFYLGVAVVALSFIWHLRSGGHTSVVLWAHLVAIILLLHGLPAAIEHEPRFGPAWTHVGIANAIKVHGRPYAHLDARFSWPGFFAAVATVLGMSGRGSALPWLRWAPVVANTLYLLPLLVIARNTLGDGRRSWILAWAFVFMNWVDQDYLSPQGFAYFIFLAILATLAVLFPGGGLRTMMAARQRPERPGERPLGPAAHRWPRAAARRMALGIRSGFEAAPMSPLSEAHTRRLLFVLVGAAACLVMSHQLTPVILVVDLVALVAVRRTDLRVFPFLVAAMLGAWISYGASDFWSGHLQALLGSGGASSVSANVGKRIGGSADHLLVVYVRVGLATLTWTTALLAMAVAARQRRKLNLTMVALAWVPFPVLLAQSYGGEAELRLYLYTLPFMLCVIFAGLRAPAWVRRRGPQVVGFMVASVVLFGVFVVAKYGNEIFEQTRPTELAAAQRMYQLAPKGSVLVAITPSVTWQYKAFGEYTYVPETLDELGPGNPAALLKVLPEGTRSAYLLVTRGQIAEAVNSYGLSRTWGANLERRLDASRSFVLKYSNADARVYEIVLGPERIS